MNGDKFSLSLSVLPSIINTFRWDPLTGGSAWARGELEMAREEAVAVEIAAAPPPRQPPSIPRLLPTTAPQPPMGGCSQARRAAAAAAEDDDEETTRPLPRFWRETTRRARSTPCASTGLCRTCGRCWPWRHLHERARRRRPLTHRRPPLPRGLAALLPQRRPEGSFLSAFVPIGCSVASFVCVNAIDLLISHYHSE